MAREIVQTGFEANGRSITVIASGDYQIAIPTTMVPDIEYAVSDTGLVARWDAGLELLSQHHFVSDGEQEMFS